MISHVLERRKDTKAEGIRSEGVGILSQPEVEKLLEAFRGKEGVTAERVEPFSVKPLLRSLSLPEDRTSFSAAGERGSLVIRIDERYISPSLRWESPVLKHVSGSIGYGMYSGTYLCALLPGPADPENIRMLVLRCVDPDAKVAQAAAAADRASTPKAASPPPPKTEQQFRGSLVDRNGIVLAESVEPGTRRYPLGALAAHVLGFTAYVERDGVTSNVLAGRNGAEKIFDEQLSKGKDVRLSLDARLQTAVEKTLRDSGIGRGAVVVTDPATGELLASASFPAFDVSRFTPKISVEHWKEVSSDPAAPLMNRAITDYSPGSIFKLVVALAACRAGDADKVYECNGSVKYGNATFRCWRQQGHGRLNLRQAITQSCNCYFYQLGNEIGIDAIEETALQLGLGTPTGLGLPGESRGLVASPTSLKKVYPVAKWTSGHTANSAIGQGFTQVSPMQMAGVVAAIANGGRVLAPRLQAGEPQELRQDLAANGYKPEHFHLLQSAMRDVVHANKGTARSADSNLIPIAGKTGSAHVNRSHGERKVDEFDGLFVGYAPADNPRYAFTVVVEGGSTGATTAAPIARRIMEAVVAGLPAPEAQPASKGHLNPIEDVRFGRN